MSSKPKPSSPPAMPQEHDVEQAVLGAALRERDALYEIMDRLTVESFAHPIHRHIWEAMRQVIVSSQPVDLHTVANQLERKGVLQVCGGRAKLIDIAESVHTAASITSHAAILVDYHKRRELWRFGHDLLRDLNDDPDNVVARAEARMLAVGEIGRHPSTESDRQIERLIATDYDILNGRLSGYNWPISDLSRVTRGIRPGKIYLLIALFKTGKSKLAIAMIHDLIARQQIPVMFLSLEMGATQVFHWLAGNALSIDTRLFGTGALSKDQMERSHQWIMAHARGRQLRVDDRAVQTPETICAALRRAAWQDGAKVVFIDYLQRIVWGERQVSVADIGRGLNRIAAAAKHHNIAVVGLCQVPKSVEQQPAGKLVTLGDVKDAAAFAEVADCSIAITDPNRHKPTKDPKRLLKFLVEQRDGPTRVLDIRADLRFGHFESVVKGTPSQEGIFGKEREAA